MKQRRKGSCVISSTAVKIAFLAWLVLFAAAHYRGVEAHDDAGPGQHLAQSLIQLAQPQKEAPEIVLAPNADSARPADGTATFRLSVPAYALAVQIGKDGTCAFTAANSHGEAVQPVPARVSHPVSPCQGLNSQFPAQLNRPRFIAIFTASKPWVFPSLAAQAESGCVIIPPDDTKSISLLKHGIEAMSGDKAFSHEMLLVPEPEKAGRIRTMEGATHKGAPSRPGKGASKPEEVTGVQGLRPENLP